jgi:phosphatidylinositol 3-kinase
MEPPDRFHYIFSRDLQLKLQIKIGTLEGKRERKSFKAIVEDPQLKFSGSYQSSCSDLCVTCQVFDNGRPLSLPAQTAYRAFSTRWNWNEWLTLPIKYSDIPRTAQIAFTIWDVYGPRKAMPVGGTVIPAFNENGVLQHGMHDLRVWSDVEADGSPQTTTPGTSLGTSAVHSGEMAKLSLLAKKHRKGRMMKMDWLDRLTFREIEQINEREKRNSNCMYLMVKFPQFCYSGQEHLVFFYEWFSESPKEAVQKYNDLVLVPDPDMFRENVVETKHHKMTRSLRHGPVARELKPNPATRDMLNAIVRSPPGRILSSEELDIVWKFRYYLTRDKKALTKFLKCVDWTSEQEVAQAVDLMSKWQPIDVEDALELLSSQFTHDSVRQYAVSRLAQASDEDLLLYLLQLVAAIRYEKVTNEMMATKAAPSHYADESDPTPLGGDPLGVGGDPLGVTGPEMSPKIDKALSVEEECLKLGPFLIARACANPVVANYLYWYIMVETESKDHRVSEIYTALSKRLLLALTQGDLTSRQSRLMLKRQASLVEQLVNLSNRLSASKENRPKRIEMLKSVLGQPMWASHFNEPLALAVDPEVIVTGIVAERAYVFKSALMPLKIMFQTTGEEYAVIFKNGDDLRQDQLILQVLTLMDKLLRRENLDLKLTPYHSLAVSSSAGFVECVPNAVTVAELLANNGTILDYFRKHAPSEHTPYGVSQEVMDTYIKSCAGYCVITYILGIGDRHLDNLLLRQSGHLFHIDFGYILGRDPKPLPPPMKLCKEMVEAMGGNQSAEYKRFREYCFNAYLILRRSANLILNLFGLMVDTDVQDITMEPDKAVKKVQDKFCLHLTEEQAVQFFQSLIDESVNAQFAVMVEKIHKWAQYWRK